MNPNSEKRYIGNWLKRHRAENFSSVSKLQKFLFFYEALAKVEKVK